ncbi:hypothetical protein BS50DRAFT_163887 [Corynespora cassiicola Philippines]|uniref:Glycosyl transferase family 25 domain-containing protein n=1 Tax=Corynespora cassiicola Philippines TaxID=1448308 RepID=A0A2T2N741_CORCC|nr:hypothetical protein BS50DRAFT_163887 [Corynespora cassiicola Philippines]
MSICEKRGLYSATVSCIIFLFVFFTYGNLQLRTPSTASGFSTQYSLPRNKPQIGIFNTTLGFEKIFVINAPWRSDRRDSLSLAASYSGIDLEWVEGINSSNIDEKAFPPGNHRTLPKGNLGSWRAHMNTIREIIQQNLTTALILEDDVDWDFRIRNQLLDFSRGARRVPDLVVEAEMHARKNIRELDESLTPADLARLSSIPLRSIHPRSASLDHPYGHGWDIIWLGHCGARLPPPSPTSPNRLMLLNDVTVPEPQHLRPMGHAPPDPLSTLYPPHTRVIHRANTTLCTLGYAVTQSGARRLLFEFGIRDFSKGYDFALSDYCNGLTRGATRETMPMCVTVSPPIFSHFFSPSGRSDITGFGSGGKETGTRYVRWSVRRNLEGLVRGDEGIIEQWANRKGS